MAPALSVLLSSVAVAAAAPSGGKKMVTKAMRPRGRTLKAEAIGRVKKFNDHASRLTGKTFSSVASTKAAEASSTSPNREMQSYWDYPMTLDYVVDIAVAANSIEAVGVVAGAVEGDDQRRRVRRDDQIHVRDAGAQAQRLVGHGARRRRQQDGGGGGARGDGAHASSKRRGHSNAPAWAAETKQVQAKQNMCFVSIDDVNI